MSLSLQTKGATILNIKWNLYDTFMGKMPYQVPEDIAGSIDITDNSVTLDKYVTITLNPFSLTVKALDGTEIYSIKGLMLDTHLNVIKA